MPDSRLPAALKAPALHATSILALLASPALAQSTTWIEGSGAGNSWTGATHWSNGAPDIDTHAIVPSAGDGGPSFVVHANNPNGRARSVQLGTTLQIRQGAVMIVGEDFVGTGAATHLRIDDANSILNVGGGLDFARGGTIWVTNDGTLETIGGAILSGLAGDPVGFEGDINGGTWANTGAMTIGDVGNAYLQVRNGGSLTTMELSIGEEATGEGRLAIGSGGIVTATDTTDIGDAGRGEVRINSGGAFNTQVARVANSAGGYGSVTVNGGAWNNGGTLSAGVEGEGRVLVENGGALGTESLVIGNDAGATGFVTVSGAASTLDTKSSTYVGSSGAGELHVLAGATATIGVTATNDLLVGYYAGGSGLVRVAGGGKLDGAGVLRVGVLGTGRVEIDGPGSEANVNELTVGAAAGSVGDIVLDNEGSLAVRDDAVIGGAGEGALIMSGGSYFEAANLTIGSIGGGGQGALAIANAVVSIDGNFTQHANSTYAYMIGDGPAVGGGVGVGGAATIADGARLSVGLDGAVSVGDEFVVLQAAGGVTGAYTLLAGGQVTAFLGVEALYDPDMVTLVVTAAQDFADVGRTRNQIATAQGLQSLGAGNPLYGTILNIATEDQARFAFDQLSGEVHASVKTALLDDSRFVRDAANSRLRAAHAATGASSLAVWGQGFGSWGDRDSDGNAASFSRDAGGLLVGADALVGDWRVGLLAGYGHASFSLSDRSSSAAADNWHLGLYGGTQWGDLAFRSGVAYSWHDISTSRHAAFAGFGEDISGSYSAGTLQAFGELGYRFGVASGTALEPFANLAHVSHRTGGYAETGGSAALSAASRTTGATFATLGLRASHGFVLGSAGVTARGMLGWRHAFGDTTPVSIHAFSGGDAFTIAGVPIGKDAALVEGGFDLALTPLATLGLAYSGQLAKGAIDQAVKANFNMRF